MQTSLATSTWLSIWQTNQHGLVIHVMRQPHPSAKFCTFLIQGTERRTKFRQIEMKV